MNGGLTHWLKRMFFCRMPCIIIKVFQPEEASADNHTDFMYYYII